MDTQKRQGNIAEAERGRFCVGRDMTWGSTLLSFVIAPPLSSLLIYIPFVLLACKLNNSFTARGDEFYYPLAVATWPTYAMLVAIVLAFLGRRIGMRWAGLVLLHVHGFIALLFYTGWIEEWLPSSGFARTGLDQWPAVQGDTAFTLPAISLVAVPLVYVIASIMTLSLVPKNR